jgi:hypothetical protein
MTVLALLMPPADSCFEFDKRYDAKVAELQGID